MTYVIEFRFPELSEPHYAGWYKDTLGFAPTIKTAAKFPDEETAARTLKNSYGEETASFGYVVKP